VAPVALLPLLPCLPLLSTHVPQQWPHFQHDLLHQALHRRDLAL